MTVKQLINELLHHPMDAELEIAIKTEDSMVYKYYDHIVGTVAYTSLQIGIVVKED